MEKPASKRLSIAYVVLAILLAPMMCFSATLKITQNPDAVEGIHGVVGVPLALFPVLGACLIAGAVGLVAGIFQPKIGVAAAAGLVLYFTGAMLAHARVADWAGLAGPILPLVLAAAALTLRMRSMPRA